MAQKSAQEKRSNDELEQLLDELGKLMDRTKVLYEQYFMGVQKLPPSQLHRGIERRIRELTREHIRNTALRYRLNNLKQKYGSYNTYWRRVCRQIENGTYARDLARVGRKAARRGEDLPPELLNAMPKRMRDRIIRDRDMVRAKIERDQRVKGTSSEVEQARMAARKKMAPGNVHSIDESEMGDLDALDLDAMFDAITSEGPGTMGAKDEPAARSAAAAKPAPAKPAARPAVPADGKPVAAGSAAPRPGAPAGSKPPPPRPRGSKPPPPPKPKAARPAARSSLPPGMDESSARDLYQKYVRAKKLVGERTDNLSYDKLMRSISKQTPTIMSKHKATGVGFNVVIKNDKVVLKAKPKK